MEISQALAKADPNDARARSDLAVGAWTDLAFKSGIVELTPGVRVDVYGSGSTSAVAVDPRVSSRLGVARHVHVIHTLGLVHQPPSFTIPLPGLAIGTLASGLQTGIQSSAAENWSNVYLE